MQLFLNATSPFARLARVVAIEKGLIQHIELVWCDPWNNDPALLAQHPQARIPVLVTPQGPAIAESLLIAHYLDAMGSAPRLVPSTQAATVLACTSVAYGLMETAFQRVITRKHEGGAIADASILGQRRQAAMQRTLEQLEHTALPTPACAADTPVHLGHLSLAVALDYVRFRLPELLPPYPRCDAWLSAMLQRPSLQDTAWC